MTDNKIVNPVKRAYRRYSIQFGIAMVLYVAAIWISNGLLYGLHPHEHGPMQHAGEGWKITIALLPLIPMFMVFAAVFRLVLRIDELQRRIYVDSLAIAGGVTALLAVTYGLIEGDFIPRPSAWC
ncbi:MAG TPA: hypothetical protein VKJ65_11020, partial [Phycisphaerae bacterium]|nr:hypothetical protein [Phycisphaerae bacterium]